MNSNQLAAYKNLELAQKAMKNGDKNAARQLAAEAAKLSPELEEVWLLMAALDAPRESVEHLEKALKINPNSKRAQDGMLWAQARLAHELAASPVEIQTVDTQPSKPPAIEENQALNIAQPSPFSFPELTPEPLHESTPDPLPEPAFFPVPEPPSEPVLESQPIPLPEPMPESLPEPVSISDLPSEPVSFVQTKEAVARPRYSYITLLAIFICLVVVWVSWQGVTPVAAVFSNSFIIREHGPAWAQANIAKSESTQPALASTPIVLEPTMAPVQEQPSEPALVLPTNTSTPLPSLTPAPTATVIIPTETIPAPTVTVTAPTATIIQQGGYFPTASPTIAIPPTYTFPAPTEFIPAPTETLRPTEVAQATATADLGYFEPASPTPLPTDTAEPFPTQYIPPTPIPGSSGGSAGRWIDVDLTNQMVYAYEGNTVVNSFVVSTGTWEYPTVTGQYHVYVKYRYTDMSGPGYYLPNVPSTMYFYKGYAIHGTYWHNNFGTPMSHGCVNMRIPEAEWIFNWASVGTLVNVHY